jgi:hypothetical protein
MDVMVIFTIHIVCLTDCLAGRNKNCLPFALVDVCLLNNKKEVRDIGFCVIGPCFLNVLRQDLLRMC